MSLDDHRLPGSIASFRPGILTIVPGEKGRKLEQGKWSNFNPKNYTPGMSFTDLAIYYSPLNVVSFNPVSNGT